ncbi:pickpocket protein 28-like [Bradysia coprophila]|uniref:pickpocket protein 28-like n=1 Tax=Bradysia coprophila TaxID=38358 RepID=UPI00187D8E5A|nr:pickpocket protein 28-like [Bradysia coprophila]
MQLSLMAVRQLQFVDVIVEMGESEGFRKMELERRDQTRSSCNENMEQYLVNSTLHGLRYVGDRKISYFERTFFGLSFVFVILLSGYFITNVWNKWSATPMIIALNSKSTSVTDIPFPAVTICNMNNAKASKVSSFVKGSFNEFLLEGLCNKRDNLSSNDFSSNWPQFREFIIDVSQSCKEMFLLCKFASKVEYCMRLFDTALTDEGLCCTFNQVHRKYLVANYNVNDEWDVEVDEDNNLQPTDWTPETGYVEKIDNFRRFYPRPGPGSGIHMGLTVVLNVNVDEYHCSSTDSKGFKVLLHSPTETPQIQNFGFSITPGYESRVVITPRISDANFKIRSIPQSQRNCIFASEGNLAYFRTYSRKNCELECQSNLILEACGCVLYYMPRTSNETSICNRDDYDCYSNTMRAIEFKRNETFTCHCLPACFELSFSGEISNAHLGTEPFHTKNNFIKAFGKGFVE